jgi:hypothetical protein
MAGSNSNQTFRGKAAPDLSGSAYLVEVSDVTDPGNIIVIHSDTVDTAKKLNLLHVATSCRHEGIMRVKIDGLVVASLRTGAGNNNPDFYWPPIREVFEGELLVIEFEAMAGRPVTDFEVYLHAREVDV